MLVHWVWLSMRPDMTYQQKQTLVQRFSDPQSLYEADRVALRGIEGLTPAAVAALLDKDLEPARRIMAECAEKHISIITYGDTMYPARLRNIEEVPLVLYCRGYMPDLESRPTIAVVGTRKVSSYGKNTSCRLGAQIAACGGVVVSGGAAGVDTYALEGALAAGGSVIAVLAGGVDIAFPAANKNLFEKICRSGCLLSEYPPGTSHFRWNFLRRNRIISGVSNGVVVVEAPQSSGALNTAKWASEQGRDVFAVPGNVDVPSSQGSNALLMDGARPVISGWNVIREYAPLYPDAVRQVEEVPEAEKIALAMVAQAPEKPARSAPPRPVPDKKGIDKADNSTYSVLENRTGDLTDEEKQVIGYLTGDPQPVDAVIAKIPLPSGRVLSILTKLAIKGVVCNHSGRRVSLK